MSQEQPPIRSRRALRQARDERLDANQEPGTPGPGAASAASTIPASHSPATPRPADVAASGVVDPGEPTEAEVTGRRRNPGPVDPVRTADGSGPPTRRQLRLLQLAAEKAAATSANLNAPADGAKAPRQKADGGTAGRGGQGPKGMTVEQALAARELLAKQAQNQLAKMEHINAVDPDVLAEQNALAERAAVLNRRTAATQKPAGQDSKPEPVRNDPAAASNLAMVTPLEFVQVPGMERPVMKRPPTSHVPVVTATGPRVERPRTSDKRRPGPSRPAAGIPAAPQSDEDFAARSPVAANTAYGLEPLDADTAGLGRARRLRLIQLAVLALGVIALIAGTMLIITGLSG